METNLCPRTPKCPIFNGVLKGTDYTETYKNLYCKAGESGRNRCKRYIISEKTGKCPENLLPNSSKTVEEIIASMN